MLRVRQIVFAARDLQHGATQLAVLLGLDAPYRDPEVGVFGLENAVFVFGRQFVEIVAPVREDTAAGRLLARRGDSGYMLILQSDDMTRERARFARLGVRTVFDVEYADIGAVHLHPKDLGGAIVSVDEPRPADSWRWGGPAWRPQGGSRDAQRVVGVCVEVQAPAAAAARWAAVLGLAQPQANAGGWRVALDGATVDFVEASARGEGISGYTLAVTDPGAVLDRARALELQVHDQAFVLLGTRIALQAL